MVLAVQKAEVLNITTLPLREALCRFTASALYLSMVPVYASFIGTVSRADSDLLMLPNPST